MKKLRPVLVGLLLLGCAGFNRSCSSCSAEQFGSDWIVVQYNLSGKPFRCWSLANTSIANEEASDGIYWVSPHANLVHISGLYNRIQIENGRWQEGYEEVGLSKELCDQIQHKKFVLEEPKQ